MKYIGLLIAVAILIAAGIVLINSNAQPAPISSPLPSPSPTSAPEAMLEGWETYEFSNGLSFSYPADFTLREDDGSVNISVWGPSQREGTELYDGLSMTFSVNEYEGSFKEFVESLHETEKQNPGTQSVTAIESAKIAGTEGYKFTEVGLGEFEITYLPLHQNNYLTITILSEDPQHQGFAETSEMILSTIKY